MLLGFETDGSGFSEANKDIPVITITHEDEIKSLYGFNNLWPYVESLVKSLYANRVSNFFHDNRKHALVMSHSAIRESITILCNDCDICDHVKMSRALCNMVNAHMDDICAEIRGTNWDALTPIDVLLCVRRIWANHSSDMASLIEWFSALDDDLSFLLEHNLISIPNLGVQSFRDLVFLACGEFRLACSSALSTIIKGQRLHSIDESIHSLMQEVVAMLKCIQQFHCLFANPFIEESHTFYANEACCLISELDANEYINHIQQRILEERGYSSIYDDRLTLRSLVRIVVTSFVDDQLNFIVGAVFYDLIEQQQFGKLKILFSYIERNEQAVERLRVSFSSYIKDRGSRLLREKNQNDIERLLQFYETIRQTAECCGNQDKFFHTMNDSFSSFMNMRQNNPAEMIAKYIDSQLRIGDRNFTSSAVERALDSSLVLFRLINGKDLFEGFYKRDFARRLLTGRSSSIDAEKSMLSKLKHECGSLFTHRLEGMLKDIETSKDMSLSFDKNDLYQLAFPMTVNVLTLSYWPNYPVQTMTLSDVFLKCQESFTEFYRTKHSGRRLQWQNSLGTCVVLFRCGSKVKELLVSVVQASILMMFNASNSLSYAEIQSATALDNFNLLQYVGSLCNHKIPVLLKNTDTICEQTTFVVNDAFKHRLFRIRMNFDLVRETPQENVAILEGVIQDRQFHLDAAIVRIMKSKRTLSRRDLFEQLFNVIQFTVEANEIDARIDSLIQRDYINKSKDDPDVYIYVM